MNANISIHMQRRLAGLIFVLGLALITGCGGVPPKRVYQPNPSGQAGKPMPLKVAVIELEDRSPGNGFTNWNLFEVFTPGYFYRTQFQKYNQTLFGTCLAAELEQSHLFEVVDYHPDWEKGAHGFRSYDIIVTGRLHQDKFERTEYTYGLLDPLGVALLLVGFPIEGTSREAMFELTAFKPHQPDRPIWTHPIKFHDSKISGMFWGHGASDLGSIRWLVNGHAISGTHVDTDFCPTELLQPHFLAMRNSFAEALKRNTAEQGGSAFAQEKTPERTTP
jgi:hypothetical protein